MGLFIACVGSVHRQPGEFVDYDFPDSGPYGGLMDNAFPLPRNNHHHHHHQPSHARVPFPCVTCFVMMASGQPVSAAQRRRGPRLRSAWRHGQQSIAMALAAATHHSVQPNAALWGQKTGTRAREEVEIETHAVPRGQRAPSQGCGQQSCWTLSRRSASWRRHEPHWCFRPLPYSHSRVRAARRSMQRRRTPRVGGRPLAATVSCVTGTVAVGSLTPALWKRKKEETEETDYGDHTAASVRSLST